MPHPTLHLEEDLPYPIPFPGSLGSLRITVAPAPHVRSGVHEASLLAVDFLEGIGFPYRLRLSFRLPGGAPPAHKLLGESACARFLGVHAIHGRLTLVERPDPFADPLHVQAVLEPRLQALGVGRRTRMHGRHTLPGLVGAILGEHGWTERIGPAGGGEAGAGQYRFRVKDRATLGVRESRMQYEESDLDFLSRHLEREGLHFYFEQTEAEEVVVFSDDATGPALFADTGARPILKAPGSGNLHILSECRRPIRGSRVEGYNPDTPALRILAEEGPRGGEAGRETVRGAASLAEARRMAGILYAASTANYVRYEGRGNDPRLRPGHLSGFQVPVAGRDSQKFSCLTLEVLHVLRIGPQGPTYANRFLAMPPGIGYQPSLETPVPRAPGFLMGTVLGRADGAGLDLDGQGRYRVALLPLQEPPAAVRLPLLQPSPRTHLRLRVDDLVLVGFVEGDVDRPFIAGTATTLANPGPSALPLWQGAEASVLFHAHPTILRGDPGNLVMTSPRGYQEFPTFETASQVRTDQVDGAWTQKAGSLDLATTGDCALSAGRDLGLGASGSVTVKGGHLRFGLPEADAGPIGRNRLEIGEGETRLEALKQVLVVGGEALELSVVDPSPEVPADRAEEASSAVRSSLVLVGPDLRLKAEASIRLHSSRCFVAGRESIVLGIPPPKGCVDPSSWQLQVQASGVALGRILGDACDPGLRLDEAKDGAGPGLRIFNSRGTVETEARDWKLVARDGTVRTEAGNWTLKAEAGSITVKGDFCLLTRGRTHLL